MTDTPQAVEAEISADARIQGMVRSIGQWEKLDPKAVLNDSRAQAEYALFDAKTDISALFHRILADRASASRPVQGVPAGWRTMESAPKDGTKIDLWIEGEHGASRYANAYWNLEAGEWQLGDFHAGQFVHRQHAKAWMPVPCAPLKVSHVKVPEGQTPLNDDLKHTLLNVFNEGRKARDNGAHSPYHGHSLEHCLHASGWVQRDLELALKAAKSAPPQPEAPGVDLVAWETDFFESLRDGTLSRVIVPADKTPKPAPNWKPLFYATPPSDARERDLVELLREKLKMEEGPSYLSREDAVIAGLNMGKSWLERAHSALARYQKEEK